LKCVKAFPAASIAEREGVEVFTLIAKLATKRLLASITSLFFTHTLVTALKISIPW